MTPTKGTKTHDALVTFRETIPDFLLSRETRDAKATTIARYRRDLEGFAGWLDAEGHPSDMDALQGKAGSRFVLDYMAHLKALGRKPGTQATIYRCLKAFWRWAVKQSIDENNEPKLPPYVQWTPLEFIDQQDAPKDVPDEHVGAPYTDDEIGRILDEIGSGRSSNLRVRRNRAILLTLRYSGVRRAELAGLLTEDYDSQRGHIMVRREVAKTTKRASDERITAILNTAAQQEVNGYVKLLRGAGKGTGYLFPSFKGGQNLRPDSVTDLINRAIIRVQAQCPNGAKHPKRENGDGPLGCDQCVRRSGVHRLRATLAGQQRLAGAPDGAIMTAFGWSTTTMLDRYSRHVKGEAALSALKKVNGLH